MLPKTDVFLKIICHTYLFDRDSKFTTVRWTFLYLVWRELLQISKRLTKWTNSSNWLWRRSLWMRLNPLKLGISQYSLLLAIFANTLWMLGWLLSSSGWNPLTWGMHIKMLSIPTNIPCWKKPWAVFRMQKINDAINFRHMTTGSWKMLDLCLLGSVVWR